MGVCDHVCATGTEEQCSLCLISQYASGCDQQREATTTAEQSGRLTVEQYNIIVRHVEQGEELFRLFLGAKAGGAPGLAGTDAPGGGATGLHDRRIPDPEGGGAA